MYAIKVFLKDNTNYLTIRSKKSTDNPRWDVAVSDIQVTGNTMRKKLFHTKIVHLHSLNK